MKHNHWGVTIDDTEPTTGVYNGNAVSGFVYDNQIDPNAQRFCPYCGNATVITCPSCDNSICYTCVKEIDWDMVDGETTEWLLGSWVEENGEWTVDKAGGDFAALYDSNINVIQVVWSTAIRYGRMCSPCYPGQVDARVDDPKKPNDVCWQPYYALPDDLLTE